MLAEEWPRLVANPEAVRDPANLVRLAHYVESSALLAGDEVLLGQCRRLSRAARDPSAEAERQGVLTELGNRIRAMAETSSGS
jgi:hypothetical protein